MSQLTTNPLPDLPVVSPLRALSPAKAAAIILAVSASVVSFLFWLIYVKHAAAYASVAVGYLPAVNATLNAVSATLLVAAFVAVRRRRYAAHWRLTSAALVSSALFFVGYVVYHHFHGDTKFLATGAVRPVYFFILISHILLSVVVVPMILGSFYLSLAGKLRGHKVLSRWTLPIWLYVSVTGVLIFAFIKLFQPVT